MWVHVVLPAQSDNHKWSRQILLLVSYLVQQSCKLTLVK